MRACVRSDGGKVRLLLASSSVAALLIGGGTPEAFAACSTNFTGPGNFPGCTNNATIPGININTQATITGNIDNTGTISTNGISVNTGSTISGSLIDTGTFSGGISIDHTSAISTAGNTAIRISGHTFTGGISNAGTVSGSNFGIVLSGVTSFGGGIENAGTISGSAEYGIELSNVGTFLNGITNSSGGVITGNFFAINIGGKTFSGGIANYGTISSSLLTAISIGSLSSFSGGISNAGTISSPGHNAINVTSVARFGTSDGGGITNSGTLAGGRGIAINPTSSRGTIQFGNASLGGGIVNSGSGKISATFTGVEVANVSSFYGGIVNNGTISAGSNGIFLVTIATFAGGITNTGTISSAGVGIHIGNVIVSTSTTLTFPVSTFSGNLSNSGTIIAKTAGILIVDASQFGATSAGGGIVNSGTISVAALGAGIVVTGVSTFMGGITNTGTISVGHNGSGIALIGVSTFMGGITNAGTVTVGYSGVGILVEATKFLGNVSNSGTIAGGGTGIFICSCVTFAGGAIVNSGTITGSNAAIDASIASTAVTIDQTAGTINGAIKLSANADMLNISGGVINGNIVGQGTADTVNFTLGSGTYTYANTISGVNTINVSSGTVVLDGTIGNGGGGTAALTIAAPGTLLIGSNTASIAPNVTDNGTFGFEQSGSFSFGNVISGTGQVEQLGPGTTTLTGANLYSGGTVINGGTLAVGVDNNLGTASGPLAFGGGTLQFLAGFTTARTITLNAGGGTFDTNGNNDALSGNIGGTGAFTKVGAGTLTLSGTSSYTGPTNVNAGTLQAGSTTAFAPLSAFTIAIGAVLDLNGFNQTLGGLAGGGNVTLGSATLTAGSNNASTTYSGAISGTGGFNKAGTGTLTLTGTDSYTGVTNINGGTLQVNGAITSSSAVNVNNGATLSGTGTVDPNPVTVNSGATLSPGLPGVPGTSLTIAGNLAFQSGALYVIYLNPTTSTSTTVTGTAALAGTVQAILSPGSYWLTRQYTILQSAGLNGTTFAGLTIANGPANFAETLSYTANNALLNFVAQLGIGTALNQNQTNVAAAINSSFNSGGTLTSNFQSLFGLTGVPLANELTQIDGEAATDAERGAFQLMDQFLELLLDPFVDGRAGPAGGGASAFAPDEGTILPPDLALAYNAVLKAPKSGNVAAPAWTAWGASYGGSGITNGNAAVGSTNVTASDYGFAAGMDYHAAPNTVLGFGLAGGGTNWSLAQGLGGGRSDAFQAGVYSTSYFGPAYLAAAAAFANHWMTTNRIALGDQLTANFIGQSFGARFEGGYRYALPISHALIGVTPYAALQAQGFHTPAYSETDLTGGGFGLAYSAMNASDIRSELGARVDDLTMLGGMPLLLRGRLAWAHDWVTNPGLDAVFQGLPGSSFLVNGATPPQNSVLTTAGAELQINKYWSLLAKFDGEFAGTAQTYAGSGTLRYRWE
jgi:autotransporter-associated beta strand protein